MVYVAAKLLAMVWVAQLWAVVSPQGEASLFMQVLLAVLISFQMFMTWKNKREERIREELHRRWAEEDRHRSEADRQRIADELKETTRREAEAVKEAARSEAERVAALAKDTREVLEKKLDENTEITRKNNHHADKLALSLSVFDKLLERQGALPPGVPNLRELLNEGSERGAEAADRPPCP
jgi:F0F1-type ATP synthase membrane subunit b/b'